MSFIQALWNAGALTGDRNISVDILEERCVMSESIWTEDMSFGLPELDASHQDILNELAELAKAPAGDFWEHYSALLDKVEKDFSNEEEKMEEMDYPGLMEHREQHAIILSALHHTAPRIMDGNIALGQEVIRELPTWFIEHMGTMDAALALAIKKRKQG